MKIAKKTKQKRMTQDTGIGLSIHQVSSQVRKVGGGGESVFLFESRVRVREGKAFTRTPTCPSFV